MTFPRDDRLNTRRIATAEMALWIIGVLLLLSAAVGFRWTSDWSVADLTQWILPLQFGAIAGPILIVLSIVFGFVRRKVASNWDAAHLPDNDGAPGR